MSYMIPLPRRLPDAIGVGAYLKTTVSVVSGAELHVSEVVGNLDGPEERRAHVATVRDALRGVGREARCVGHDLHPDYPTTRMAKSLGLECVPVQHHHAHILATATENGVFGPVLGLALDGFGLGPGGESWGGECLYVNGADYRRVGRLSSLPQAGGDAASLEPWRMAAGFLHKIGRASEIPVRFADQKLSGQIAKLLDSGVNVQSTSSGGRLFDAAAALAGLHPVVTFEGEAPMALERLVTEPEAGSFRLYDDGVLDLTEVLADIDAADPVRAANRFHGTLIAGLIAQVSLLIEKLSTRTVVLSGGCFFNSVLRDGVTAGLQARGLTVISAGRATPGDNCISLGQAVAAALHQERV